MTKLALLSYKSIDYKSCPYRAKQECKRRHMASSTDAFERAFVALSEDVASAVYMEQMLCGKPLGSTNTTVRTNGGTPVEVQRRGPVDILSGVLQTCIKKRKLSNVQKKVEPSNEELFHLARFTDKFKLVPYRNFLHFVPRIVNVVTVRSLACLSSAKRLIGCFRKAL